MDFWRIERQQYPNIGHYMYMSKTQSTNNVPDLNQSRSDTIQETIKSIQNVLVTWNYSFIDTPLLEPAEIFLRKSGEAYTWETYNLTDSRGERFALRPEFTSSVARHILQSANTEPFPIRKCYAGPVFRNDARNRQQSQFNQVGAELIGVGGVDADAEVVALAASALRDGGYPNLKINIGNVGVASNLLKQFGLSQRTIALLLSRLDWLTNIEENAAEIGLQIGRSEQLPSTGSGQSQQEAAQGEAILLSLLSSNDNQVIGSRSLDEIVERYMKRVGASQNVEQTQLALEFLAELTTIQGTLEEANHQAKALVEKWQLDPTSLNWIESFTTAFEHYAVEDIELTCDFSLTHDVRYYTGMVFEIVLISDDATGNIPICSGGRYDMLYRSLGATDDTPALGFAISVETLLNSSPTLDQDLAEHPFKNMGILVVPADLHSVKSAIDYARQIRALGERVGILPDSDAVLDLHKYAKANMINRIRWISQAGIEKEQSVD